MRNPNNHWPHYPYIIGWTGTGQCIVIHSSTGKTEHRCDSYQQAVDWVRERQEPPSTQLNSRDALWGL